MTSLNGLTQFAEKRISEYRFPAKPENLYDPLHYFLKLGGKRLRPVLTLISAEMFDISKEESIHAALAIEFFHNFSLIHDDIMDKAPLRRGKETVHTKWNESIAILSGDVLFTEAYVQLSNYPDQRLPELLKRFNETAKEVCEGQQMDMDFETAETVSKEEYIEMIRLKTSVLVGCALEFGAILGNADIESRKAIYNFGVELGIAFQIQDDLLDLYGDPETFGKQIGGDIISNKKTLLLLSAIEKEGNSDKIAELLSTANNTDKVETARKLFLENGAVELTEAELAKHYQNALQSLSGLNVGDKSKMILTELAENLISRKS